MPNIYIGVDPGVGGGIAFITGEGTFVEACRMPETEADILHVLGKSEYSTSNRAILERVRSSPQMGVVSAFTFGCGYGGLRMALHACGIPFDEVTPLKWQNVLGCRTRGDKNVTKRRAQELFHGVKVTHAIADALLLAEYGRRAYERGPSAAR